jgi:hypothetical protein
MLVSYTILGTWNAVLMEECDKYAAGERGPTAA